MGRTSKVINSCAITGSIDTPSMSRDFVFKSTFADVERILKEPGEERSARFEFECYDVGHLYNLAHFLER